MIALDSKLLKKFLKDAGQKLQGEWILIGGTVLPLLGVEHRVTVDIDLLPLKGGSQNSNVLELMKLAEGLGLPVEIINQAGLFFLEKIPNYQNQLVVLHKGKSATIYRPQVNLFLRLKISRLTESDLDDCLQFIKIAKKLNESLDIPELVKLIDLESRRPEIPQGRLERLGQLKSTLVRTQSKK